MANPRLQGKVGKPCPYCTRIMVAGHMKLMPTSDHIIPRAVTRKGKSRTCGSARRNGRTIVTCSECNFMKGDLSFEQFIQSLIEKNKILLQAVETNIERMKNIDYYMRIGLEE